MKVLSEEKLQKMADYIENYMRSNNGDVPRFSEILEHMQMNKSVGYRYLMELKNRGIVEYSGKGTLTMQGWFAEKSKSVRVPILGNIVCGIPEEEEETALGYLALPAEWTKEDSFLLRAYGDSMVDAGINEGDLVLIKRCTHAKSGQIVAALTEEGNTLKRIFFEGRKPRLHAENRNYPDEMKDIYPQKLQIQGVAVKLIKDFE